MRWRALFEDLEGQWEAADAQALRAEVGDRSRREASLLTLNDRVAAAVGSTLGLTVQGAGTVHGVLVAHGPDWLLVEQAGREVLVPSGSLLGVTGLGRASAAPGSSGVVVARLDLRWALRGLARDRRGVGLLLVDGSALDGTLDRVGVDHLEIAEHPPGEARRRAGVQQVRLVPLPALALVRAD